MGEDLLADEAGDAAEAEMPAATSIAQSLLARRSWSVRCSSRNSRSDIGAIRYRTDASPIRIAGAGPSGLAAAIVLARAGREVEVHEAKRDVGMRFIGDLQIIEGASEREPVPDFLDRIGIERNFYFRPADWATFYDHRGNARA